MLGSCDTAIGLLSEKQPSKLLMLPPTVALFNEPLNATRRIWNIPELRPFKAKELELLTLNICPEPSTAKNSDDVPTPPVASNWIAWPRLLGHSVRLEPPLTLIDPPAVLPSASDTCTKLDKPPQVAERLKTLVPGVNACNVPLYANLYTLNVPGANPDKLKLLEFCDDIIAPSAVVTNQILLSASKLALIS